MTLPCFENTRSMLTVKVKWYRILKIAPDATLDQVDPLVELESSSLRVMLTYPRAKNLWNRFLIRAPVFGLWPKTCPKWPKIEKMNSSYSFWARILPFSEYHHLIMPKKFMDQNFNLGPGFWAMAQRAQNGLKLKIELLLQFLSYEACTYPRAKNSWNRFIIGAPSFGLKRARNGPK